MSHFTVMVIGEDPDEQLEDFWELDLSPEELEADPRAVFEDCTDEVLSDWNGAGTKTYVLPDNTEVETWELKPMNVIKHLPKEQLKLILDKALMAVREELIELRASTKGSEGKDIYSTNRIDTLSAVLSTLNNMPRPLNITNLIEIVQVIHTKADTHFKATVKDCDEYKEAETTFRTTLKTRMKPYSEEYKTIDNFASKYSGYSSPEEGVYGYYHNPDAKWDWHSVGGRWSGYFKLKRNDAGELPKHEVGSPGVFDNKAKKGWADQCRIKDIDIEGMYEASMKEAAKTYDKFEEVTAGLELPPTWKKVRESYSEEDIDKARTEYAFIPYIKAINKANLNPWGSEAMEYYFINNGGRERFIENAKCKSIVPFAVLMDGEWHEKGEMGWFGMTMNEKSTYDWVAKFTELWENLPEDTLVTLVDAHI